MKKKYIPVHINVRYLTEQDCVTASTGVGDGGIFNGWGDWDDFTST